MTNPHAEWLAKLADGIRDVLSPSEYQRMKFCAEMLEALDGRPAEPRELHAKGCPCPTCLNGTTRSNIEQQGLPLKSSVHPKCLHPVACMKGPDGYCAPCHAAASL